jgi:cytochrome b561
MARQERSEKIAAPFNSNHAIASRRYGAPQIALHWLIVLPVISQYATSGSIARTHAVGMSGLAPSKSDLFLHMLHNRFGLLIFCLLAALFGLRLLTGAPPSANAQNSWQEKLSILVHFGLYGILGLQAATGAVATYFWWPISAVHRYLFWTFIALVTLHAAAALWHQLMLKDGLLWRITGLKFLRAAREP